MIEVAGLSSVTDTESLRVSGLGNARLLLVNCLRERFAQMLEDMKKPIQVRLPSHNHILVIRDPSRTARKRTILPSNLSPDSAKIKATDLLLSDMYRPRWNTSPRRNLGVHATGGRACVAYNITMGYARGLRHSICSRRCKLCFRCLWELCYAHHGFLGQAGVVIPPPPPPPRAY